MIFIERINPSEMVGYGFVKVFNVFWLSSSVYDYGSLICGALFLNAKYI